MIITVLSYKGGTSKTNTAIHLAGCLAEHGQVLLADGDLNRSAVEWASCNGGLPFTVCDYEEIARYSRKFENGYIVIDTAARPAPERLKPIVNNCDHLILTTSPDAVSMRALRPALADLRELDANFKILLTLVPPVGSVGAVAQAAFTAQGFPVFQTCIRRYAAYQRAALNGRLVNEESDANALAAWGDYQNLAKEILSEQ